MIQMHVSQPKAVILIFTFLILISICFAQFAGGTGSQEDPYLIETAAHLDNVHYHLDACYRQIADIDLGVAPYNQGTGWWHIGVTNYPPNTFSGRYNGSGHTISNLYIQSTWSGQGLFGGTNNAFIDSINLINVNIVAHSFTGGLVGNVSSTSINDCHVEVNIVAESYVGGLVGLCDTSTTVTGCSSTGTVAGNYYIGGLIGALDTSTLSKSYSNVNIHSNLLMGDVGGLVGYVIDSDIEKCHSGGEIWGSGAVDNSGGLIGKLEEDSTINNCYALGAVTGDYNVGGLVGNSWLSSINNCYAIGAVTGSSAVGGLVGSSRQSSINDCFAIGAVSGESYNGGLMGFGNSSVTVVNSYWNTQTSGCSISAGGEGRTTDDMTFPFAANTYVDWDFTNIWVADFETNYGYPYLNTSSPVNTVAEPTFSPVSGDYTEPISVVIQTATPDALIYYTLNGLDPSPQSCLYSEPILIDSTTVIKTRAYKEGWNPSTIAVSTYVYNVANNDLLQTQLISSCTIYPNPFYPATTISFNLLKAAHASLDIYNLKGQKICSLANDNFSKGEHSLKWDGRTDEGKTVPCGMYLYKLKGDGFELTRKLTLMK